MVVQLASVRTADAVTDTLAAQATAADPAASAWVGANAGAGKTHVLTMRVLRLMLAGVPLERILCLTYTKAAAAEMSKRVFADLARWAIAPPQDLRLALAKLMGRVPEPVEIARGRALFANAIETPGGLKVQTIHAFSEKVLQRFPLEAGVPPGFVTMDEDQAKAAQREAIDAVLREATQNPGGRLGRALTGAVRHASGDSFDEILREALGQRAWLEETIRWPRREAPRLWGDVDRLYREFLGVRGSLTRDVVDRELTQVLSEPALNHLADALTEGGSSDQKTATKIRAALSAATINVRLATLQDLFCTEKGEARKALMTKALKAAHPDLESWAIRAQEAFCKLLAERHALVVAEATLALLEIADAVMQRYTETKARRAALDFEDLVGKAASLLNPASLSQPTGSAAWVLFRLDGGLDHILVDEAQDTSPTQWTIVKSLADEFFSGSGARETARTVFAVGDEKQSIYGFQGASPEMFMETGRSFAESALCARRDWRDVSLDVSFRSVSPILEAVDRVFADHARTPGLLADRALVQHRASRSGQAGLVEVWPVETPDATVAADPWSPLDEVPAGSAILRLAGRIAATIRRWLDHGGKLLSEDRPVRPGDILILVRHRRPFAPAMVAALEAQGIPVAGADRLRLAEQIAVCDLLALGDVLVLPDDDLQLAALLKSPLFGFDDDDLLALAHDREGSLEQALEAHATRNPRYGEAASTLSRWRAEAALVPPFEFYASVLDRDGGRSRMLARLGPEAADPIDEFLNLALAYDDGAPPSLLGFLQSVRSSDREIKRDMDEGRDAVRVMTVHGAKGLEAPIVFLPDTCGTKGGGRNSGLLRLSGISRPAGFPEPFVWAVKGAGRVKAIAEARERAAGREIHERHRLLYVAMTRARDRLYIAGWEGKRGRGAGCWYDLVHDALEPGLEAVESPDGSKVLRLFSPQTGEHETPRGAAREAASIAERPVWAGHPAPIELRLAVPVTPSGLVAYEKHEGDTHSPSPGERGESRDRGQPPADRPASGSGDPTEDSRFLRGTLTHALLEHLPSLPPESWPAAAAAYIARRGAGLDSRARAETIAQALGILRDPTFAPLFGPKSRAEVGIAALLPRPQGNGPPLKLSGQIDRLAVVGNDVLVVDYKTNRMVPTRIADVPEAYLFQLAAYRLALARIFPGSVMRGAILWTARCHLMEVPAEKLDEFENRFWQLHPPRLDAGGRSS